MSAESKKKRGESGAKNAKAISFRYHGVPKDYSLSTHIGRPQGFAGGRFLAAMILGAVIGGSGYQPSLRMYNAADEAMARKEARGYKRHESAAFGA